MAPSKAFLQSLKLKQRIRQDSREVTTRDDVKDGFVNRQFINGASTVEIKVKLRFVASGKPGFTEQQFREKLFEMLKEIDI